MAKGKRKREEGGEEETRRGKAKATKLERLLKLLSEGQTRDIRTAAAEQIARISVVSPLPILKVLNKVKALLYNKRWDTRCAAAHCLENLAERCAEEVRRSTGRHASNSGAPASLLGETCLSFEDLKLDVLLRLGKPLLANSGKEYDVEEYGADLTDEEKLKEARMRLDKNIGLTGGATFFDSSEIVSNHDLMVSTVKVEGEPTVAVSSLMPTKKKQKVEVKLEPGSAKDKELTVLQCFEVCSRDFGAHLFDEHWDIRHGAALGLRAMFCTFGDQLFGSYNTSSSEVAANPWHVDFGVRIVCVLALDRLGDFFSEKTTAPVKETSAQALGYLIRFLRGDKAQALGDLFTQMMREKEWHIQHGGLLGFKYLLIGDPSMKNFSDEVVELFGKLISTKADDDVFSAAVENLILLIDRVTIRNFPAPLLRSIHEKVWHVLPQLDELHASISNCLGILKMVCGVEDCDTALNMDERLKVLMKFACHPSLAVRLSAISTYNAVLRAIKGKESDISQTFWLDQCVFWVELTVIEQDAQVVEEVLALFEKILKQAKLTPSPLYNKNLDHLLAMAVLQDYSQLTSLHLRYYDYLQLTNVLLGSGAATKSSKKSAEAKLTFGCLTGRLAMNVRVDVGHCLALYMNGVEGEPVLQKRVEGLLQLNSYCSKLLAYIIISDTIKHLGSSGQELEPELPQHIVAHVQITYKGMCLREVGSTFRELSSKARNASLALSKICTSIGKGQDELMAMPLKALIGEVSQALQARPDDKDNSANFNMIDSLEAEVSLMTTRLRTEAAACAIASKSMPPKLNFVIQPLMESVRTESDAKYQRRCGSILASLIHYCKGRSPSPNAKLIKNLCARGTIGIDALEKEAILQDLDVVRAGAVVTLEETVKLFGSSVLEDLPMLLTKIASSLSKVGSSEHDEGDLLHNVTLLTQLKEVMPVICEPLCGMLENLSKCTTLKSEKISYIASRALVEISRVDLEEVIKVVFFNLLPLLQNHGTETKGILQLLGMLSEAHKTKIAEVVPYILVDMMPLLNSHDASVRPVAAEAFAKMFPIFAVADEKCDKVPSYLESCSINVEGATALQKIFNASEIDDFTPPFSMGCKLRSYQQEGLNWLHFLQRFGMNGILADDMGLGKTLQTLLIMASVLGLKKDVNAVSIIVAPSTLVAHWQHEIGKYLPENLVRVLKYVGTSKEREKLRNQLPSCNCVITSYDVVRREWEWLAQQSFQYCILDEGHLIKNPDSTLSQACKRLKSEHRLILTGTPIQNDVLEIWSLFDFLMPGFLGAKKDFNKKYRSGVNAGKRAGSTKKDRDASILVADQLHRQINPFVLRRTKDMVLKDLPSKIIQDIHLEMSPLQKMVYSELSGGVDNCLQVTGDKEKSGASAFAKQVHMLAKACTHPAMAMKVMEAATLEKLGLSAESHKYEDIAHAPKLVALVELLQQCGIMPAENGSNAEEDVGAQEPIHQILVFAQAKGTLDLIERSVLNPSGIPFLRIDGAVEAGKRHDIAMQFQSDPTIPVLLLTTRVGGLGLNLTAADTVFFIEHDWNPMMDMQAMDRAHRLGQTSTVNVFRAIIKDSYEERLMSMQRFKIGVAETVVSMENASVKTLNAGDFVDLFSNSAGKPGEKKQGKPKNIVEELSRNWEELYGGHYDDDFSIERFQSKLS
ncbi:SNF2 superfamily protein [Chloropicon primus]|nr:SNF2 superfamily protein [Chloropicon primus]